MFCNQLNHTLSFFPEKISACCSGYNGPLYIENPQNNQIIDLEKINKIKMNAIEQLENNIVPKGCEGCYELQQGKSVCNDYKIKRIVLNHYTHCNCKCVYCARLCSYKRDFTEISKKSDYYDFLPILKNLYDNNLVDKKNLIVDFQGGDLSVLDETDKIIDFLLKNGVYKIYFVTNNILYQHKILQCIKIGKGVLITSLDAGCKETYLKMKKVDKFDICVKNLSKYISYDIDLNKILVKYIITQHFNDNLEELKNFLNIMKTIHIKRIQIDIDFNKILIDKSKTFIIPHHYYDMYDFAEMFCKKNNIKLEILNYTKNVLKNGRVN